MSHITIGTGIFRITQETERNEIIKILWNRLENKNIEFERYIYVYEDYEIQRLMFNQYETFKFVSSKNEKFYVVKHFDKITGISKITLINSVELTKSVGKKFIFGNLTTQPIRITKTDADRVCNALNNTNMKDLKISSNIIKFENFEIQRITDNLDNPIETLDKEFFIVKIKNNETDYINLSSFKKVNFEKLLKYQNTNPTNPLINCINAYEKRKKVAKVVVFDTKKNEYR
jgi:hypothetical protein